MSPVSFTLSPPGVGVKPPRACCSGAIPFAALPHALTADQTLKDADVRLLAVLLRYCRDKPSCWPSVHRLAEDMGRSERAIQYALARLREAGWIAVRPASNPTGRVIVMTWRDCTRRGVQPYSQGLPRKGASPEQGEKKDTFAPRPPDENKPPAPAEPVSPTDPAPTAAWRQVCGTGSVYEEADPERAAWDAIPPEEQAKLLAMVQRAKGLRMCPAAIYYPHALDLRRSMSEVAQGALSPPGEDAPADGTGRPDEGTEGTVGPLVGRQDTASDQPTHEDGERQGAQYPHESIPVRHDQPPHPSEPAVIAPIVVRSPGRVSAADSPDAPNMARSTSCPASDPPPSAGLRTQSKSLWPAWLPSLLYWVMGGPSRPPTTNLRHGDDRVTTLNHDCFNLREVAYSSDDRTRNHPLTTQDESI